MVVAGAAMHWPFIQCTVHYGTCGFNATETKDENFRYDLNEIFSSDFIVMFPVQWHHHIYGILSLLLLN